MTDYRKRDLWQEARAKSASRYRGLKELWIEVSTSFRGSATKKIVNPSAIAKRPDVVIMPDFNKYRIRDLKPYVDFGCKAFMFRMGGPAQWVQGIWQYTMDPTWRTYMDQADKLGVLGQTIGYIVHNPFESWTINTVSNETVHTQLVDEWTQGGYMPAAFCYDHEVATCWTNVGAQINCTDPNLRDSLDINTNNTYKKFRRTVSIYTANWFMRAHGWDYHDTYFYNVNKPESMGGAGTQRPLMEAWYLTSFTGTMDTMDMLYSKLSVPTPEQVSSYLYCGYQANAWQFTSALKIGTDTVGVDCSISLDPYKQFFYLFGLQEPGAVTPPPPPPPPPSTDPNVETRLAALETAVGKLSTHTHTTLGPTL